MITEQDQNLSDPQFMTLAHMETYCESKFGSLLYLQLESVGVKPLDADQTASHMAKHNLSQEAPFGSPTITPVIQDATLEVATAAHVRLADAQSYTSNLPQEALPVLMAEIPIESYLTPLEKVDLYPLAPNIQ
ncbi:NADH dehydrogenase (ubiquinone) complex I, assembly factor 6 [Mortierella hygrophila]|uniref:NADH dehydrogenase (Ubiquinone) complex I, assembly factor 6 n=1 Tax=Mortierella hygrophila TaxID=979708 RepID=A0A9P6EW34_9FUNG|nr:NADH dehydrogenase (ubiquinone) complex I, assembly factor 6 [Mortierella hygrophila]